jgi:tetratricopeptide (TPR) repeat protein
MVSVAVTGEKAGKKTDNYWALSLQAQQLMEAKKWTEARALLTTIAALNPAEKGADTPYRPLVAVLRELGDTEAERATLTKWAAIDDEAPEAYLRLMELGAAASDWPAVRLNAERFLRVNPLVAPPWRYLAQASTAAHDAPTAINALRILLQLEPADPAAVHFQLAQLLHQTGANDDARRHTLLALEEAPRYREALKLLLELRGADAPPGSPKT